ncbi:armadillo-like helical domain-containing protein 4 isoform X2 [Mugil cephalus]|uniref:armadillo-like helical domain-containing protein 4 isoform X2 n=1 Tax=Mugil cephalus TaxID=48193 RepID=UPI001FB79C57|nr:armadillo-like helical domain-containing protein 4 isoform X2 [Mugil cephalus]
MWMSGTLRRLLLAWSYLCVYGAPVQLPNFSPTTQDSSCERECASSLTTPGSIRATDVKPSPPDTGHVMGLVLNAGGGGGTGPDGRPEGIEPVTQTENGDSLGGRSGPSEDGTEARSQRRKVKSTLEIGDPASVDPESRNQDVPVSVEDLSPPGDGKQTDMDLSIPERTPGRSLDFTTAPPQLDRVSQTMLPGFDPFQDKDPEPSLASSPEPPNPSMPPSHNPIPPLVFITPRTSTPFALWGHDGATISSLPDPYLPEIGPSLIPREDSPESLWTEASRPGGDTAALLSQDEATEATMSSEALPLIFEPFEDVTPEGAAAAVTLVPGSAQPPGAMATRGLPLADVDLDQLVTVESDSDGPSQAKSMLMPDWTSPWQTSGAELLEPIGSSGPSTSQQQGLIEMEDGSEKVAERRPNLEDNLPSTDTPLSSFQHAMTTVTTATHHPVHKSRSGLEEMESEEEDEDDENSEESVEEDSEEDLTETPKTSSTQPPYSLIPPPPVWVQQNQGLMRSWVELIREKAGYVSGMLAPVGIGITGALLIVGALYSIRMIHRKRRNSFKHQRRKQPREPGTSRQDQAMLLADSSEDEF